MGMPTTVTLSSAGSSPAVALNPLGSARIGVTVTATGASTGAFTIQLTLDDVTNTVSTRAAVWVNDPAISAVASSLAVTSTLGVVLYQQPLAGIRLNSTAFPSSVGAPLYLKVNQGLSY